MAEDIRVRHTELRGPLVVAVRDLTERIPNPRRVPWPGCSICSLPSPGHEGFKTRHVEIDADGCGIVSEGVWEGLCHLFDNGGFVAENPVAAPPRQSITFQPDGTTKLEVHHRIQRPIILKQGDK